MSVLADKFVVVQDILPFLLLGLWSTVLVSLLAILFGSLLGFVLGVLRSLRLPLLSRIIGLYLHLYRGSPFLVQLYLVYFVLPETGIAWLAFDSFTAAVAALSLYTSSYVTEIVASAISAVPKGQAEAACAVGMNRFQTLYYVVVPQALRLTVPSMAGVYVIIIKNTAILSVIGISELTRQGEINMLRMPAEVMFIYVLIAALYFVYCYPVLRFAKWAEKRVGGVAIRPE